MRIGVDMCYAQFPSVFHGIGNYSFHHITYLAEHPDVDIFYFQPIYSTLSREAYIAELSRFIIENRLDFFHFPSPMQVPYPDVVISGLLPPVYFTAMVFDLISSVFPEEYLTTKESAAHYDKLLEFLRCMDLLLTISEYTRTDLIKFNFDPGRVFLSGFGRDEGYYVLDDSDISDLSHLFPVDKPYILAFTPSDFRKNTNRLLSAFSTALRKTNADVHLLFLNVMGEEQIHQLIAEYGLTGRAHSGGRVTKPQLLRLYNRALGLAFPSLYEGIGLPVLEAMQCGLPVLSSNTSSLPEVVGDAAIIIDPLNENSIAYGLEALIANGRLRENLRARGLARALLFDWRDTARRTVGALWQLYQLGPKKPAETPRPAQAEAQEEAALPDSEERRATMKRRRKRRRKKRKGMKRRRRLRLRRRNRFRDKSMFKARRKRHGKKSGKRSGKRSGKKSGKKRLKKEKKRNR